MNYSVCPTITAYTPEQYMEQLEKILPFAKRIHFDYMDGKFTQTTSVPLAHSWWPRQIAADVHIMHQEPMAILKDVLAKMPNLVIVHQEATDVSSFVHELHERRVRVGIAILQQTPVDTLTHYINVIDHVLIFSGHLGYHGGTADLGLLEKVRAVRTMSNSVEIGWDGGITPENITELIQAGVSVCNVGGCIHGSDNPEGTFHYLEQLMESARQPAQDGKNYG